MLNMYIWKPLVVLPFFSVKQSVFKKEKISFFKKKKKKKKVLLI